jgi:NAD(P)-dependent dehydrogenase (short-subunit alcohol dehydrogenase family)
MDKVLQDRIALVTGGAQGLGEAICHRLAKEGCHVVVADLNEEKAIQTAKSITASTDRPSGVHDQSLCKRVRTSRYHGRKRRHPNRRGDH